jgi:branched-chain amino acid transport system substrate-binding protein
MPQYMSSWLLAATATIALAAQPTLAAQIIVGQVGPMSGLEATQGRAYSAGLQLYFNAVNKSGGINGHTFMLVRRDDGGHAEETVALTRKMIAEDKPLVLAGYFGNKNIDDVVAAGLLAKEKLSLVGYRAMEVRTEVPYLYSVRAGTRDELNKITDHLAIIGITRLGLFYEAGPGAQALITVAEEAVRRTSASIDVRASYQANTASVNAAVDAFLKQPPQAILMVCSGAAAAGFIENYRSRGGAAQLFAHSGADIEQLSKRLVEEQMQGVAIAQVTPSPYKSSSLLAREFNDNLSKASNLEVPVSYAMMEGYIAARVIAEAVRRQGRNPSREGMAQALDSINNYDMGGYLINFRPGQRSGSKFVELSIVNSAGRIRQ